jgi:hypothetical protein
VEDSVYGILEAHCGVSVETHMLRHVEPSLWEHETVAPVPSGGVGRMRGYVVGVERAPGREKKLRNMKERCHSQMVEKHVSGRCECMYAQCSLKGGWACTGVNA